MTPHQANLVVSFSGGKDSTAMLHRLLEAGEPIHTVLWYVTPWEFMEMHDHAEDVERRTDITITRIQPRREWDTLLARYGWPHPAGGWCTAEKRQDIGAWIAANVPNPVECIGFSDDERPRAEGDTLIRRKKWPLRFPLIEHHMGEMDALGYCNGLGYNWDGLYDWMPSRRVSCWACPKQSDADFAAIARHRPKLWRRMLEMEHPAARRLHAMPLFGVPA